MIPTLRPAPAPLARLLAALACAASLAAPALAADPPKPPGASPANPAKPSVATSKAEPGAAKNAALPGWEPPPAYRVDMVMTGGGKTFTMKRFIAGERIRSEIEAEGQSIVMIELDDEAGTTWTLMPKEKQAIKSSRKQLTGEAPGTEEVAKEAADVKVEDLGAESVGGVAARKYRMTMEAGTTLAWFDAASSAPLRMESLIDGETAVLEWKNLEVGPQPARLYEVPKNFEVIDMDEMMSQMKAAGGMAGMSGLAGMGGMAGMGGVGGMAQQAGQSFGEGMGGSLGASLGGAFGGPLGATAGQYIGGKVGGWLGRKTAAAVTPGR